MGPRHTSGSMRHARGKEHVMQKHAVSRVNTIHAYSRVSLERPRAATRVLASCPLAHRTR
eukprot:6600812-Prymnesium_polylepis.1